MATVPTPFHFTALTVPTASNMNAGIESALAFLLSPPRCKVYNSAAQSIGSGAFAALTWDTEEIDSDAMHSTSSNTSRLVCQTAGTYLLSGSISWASSSAGVRRGARWLKNGASSNTQVMIVPPGTGTAGVPTVHAPTVMMPLAVSDYVELAGYQDTGGALSTVAGITGCFAQALWVSS